jgi:hypothetical protein
MLCHTNALKSLAMRATDGAVGHVKDLFFDDEAWVLRYFVVQTHCWPSIRKVLVSPLAVQPPHWQGMPLTVSLTKRQVEGSAALDTESAHLRSCDAVVGYHLQTRDGESGCIAGFLVDEGTWAIRYLVVETSNGWLRNKVLLAPACISGLHWDSETASTGLGHDAIQAALRFDPRAPRTPSSAPAARA